MLQGVYQNVGLDPVSIPPRDYRREDPTYGGKSDGWAAIQDFRVEINMLLGLHSKSLI